MRGLFTIVLLTAMYTGIVSVSAQSPTLIPDTGVLGTCDFRTGDLHFDCVPLYIGYLIKVLIGFSGGFFFFGIIMGGYKIALKSASQDRQAGLNQLKGAFIGITVVVFSYLIVDTLLRLLT